MFKKLFNIIRFGMYDDDPMSSIFDEVLVEYFGMIRGPYAKTINNTLKQYSGINPVTGKANFALGTHIKRSDGDVWTIRKQPGAKSEVMLSLADEIEESLTRANCFRRVAIEAKPLRVILYHTKPMSVHLSAWLKEVDSLPKNKFLIAPAIHWKGKKEALVALDMTQEKFCHILVAGVTGSGKSQLLLSMILSLAINNDPEHVSIVVIDPKGIDFARSVITRLPHLATAPIIDLNQAQEVIHSVRVELDRRMQKGDYAEAKKGIFIFCDEVASITEHSKQAIDDLTAIARLGRAWNVHLIAATQRPTSKSIDTTLRSQLVCNLTGNVTSPEEAKYATGHAESGADRLPGYGAFILNCPQYFNHRVQGLLSGDYSWIVDTVVNAYKGQEAHYKLDNNESIDANQQTLPERFPIDDGISKVVSRRMDFVQSLIEKKKSGEVLNDSKVRQYHKDFYDKGVDGNSSKVILEYVEEVSI